MSEAPRSPEGQREITVSELEQYLQKSIRPSVIPSTFKIVEMEFGRLAVEQSDSRILLEQMMLFFRTSHRVVYEKLMGLYEGLYITPDATVSPPNPVGLPAQRAASPEVNNLDWDDTGDNAAGVAAAVARARSNMPTLSEEDLNEIYSMPTLRPAQLPQPAQSDQPDQQPAQESAQPAQPFQTVQESAVRKIPRRGIRMEAPTIPDLEKTAELAEQIRAEIQFFGQEEEDLPALKEEEGEDSDPGFHDRVTLVEAPSPDLIKISSDPPPPDEKSAQAGAPVQPPEKSGATPAVGLFSITEEEWFEEAEKTGRG